MAETTQDDRNFDAAVDWLLNHGAVDFDMQNCFRAIACGLITPAEADRLDAEGVRRVRQILVEAGEVSG